MKQLRIFKIVCSCFILATNLSKTIYFCERRLIMSIVRIATFILSVLLWEWSK